ncbi:UNVERIFIED_CONTAM: hypothetical protein FKN15_031439 [Acipenser sinensis]
MCRGEICADSTGVFTGLQEGAAVIQQPPVSHGRDTGSPTRNLSTSSDSIKEKSSLLDCQVTMYYSTTNRFEQLTMSQLGKMAYPQVFEQQTATHIVMAVLYGAQAFFVFDQMSSEEENKQDIEGNLNVMVKKIPNFSIEGKGALKMTDKDKESVQKFSCTFHGDFEIKQNPTTYLEALDVYKTLPGLLGEKREKEVPVRVWLYPLKHLDSEAAKLVREISVSLVSGAETALKQLNESHPEAAAIPDRRYRVVQSGVQSSAERGSDRGAVDSHRHPRYTRNLDPYLTVLMKYLHSEEFKMLQAQRNFIKNVETQPWFTSPTLSATMRVNLESFRGFAEANKYDKKTSFLIASVSDTSCPGASIYLYRRGKLENPQFQPVSKPNPPVLTDTQPDRVTLNLLPSQTGETERYRVEYRAVQRGAQTEGQWTVTDTPDTQGTWTLSGLQAGTLYQIRYRSVSAVGVSEASEAIEIQTKPNPRGPEELSIKRVGFQTAHVTWQEPASEEERRSVLHYTVEYKNDRWEEWVAKLSKPGECVCTLEGLKYYNPYRVRVSAVFTEAETSAASQEAEVPPMQGKRIGFVSE